MNGTVVRWSLIGLSSTMLFVTLYLLYASSSVEGSIAGCGEGSNCDLVLSSKWAYWLGIPVTILAFPFYLIQLLSATRLSAKTDQACRRTYALLFFALSASCGTAIWFLFIQAAVLRTFCPLCTTIHICALISGFVFCLHFFATCEIQLRSVTPLVAASMAIVSLIAGQLLHHPKTHETILYAESDDSTSTKKLKNESKIQVVRFMGGEYDVDGFPIIGEPTAENVMVEFFDYTCWKCRIFYHYLRQAHDKYQGNQIATVLIPVPYEQACNPQVQEGKSRKSSCEYAAIALSVWQANPQRFEAFNEWIHRSYQLPTIEETLAHAEALVGKARFHQARRQISKMQLISKGLEIKADVFSKKSIKGNTCGDSVPKLVVNTSTMIAGLPNSQSELLDTVKSTLNLKVGVPAPLTLDENEELWESKVTSGNRVEFSP